MDVRQTRRNNLAALLATRGARKALAEAVDSDPAYLSQLLSPRIKADMGHDLARRIERALGKPPGWMDQPHDDAPRVAEPAGEYQATVREVDIRTDDALQVNLTQGRL